MKTFTLFCLLILLSTIRIYSQAGKVTINSVTLNNPGMNQFIRVNAYLNANGNAGMTITYSCNSTILGTTPCLAVPGNTPIDYDTPQFACSGHVHVSVSAYNGTNCTSPTGGLVILGNTNLYLNLTGFSAVLRSKNELCFNWAIQNPDPQNVYQIESSGDGILFSKDYLLSHQDSYISNNNFKVCLKNNVNHEYFRLKIIEKDGAVTFSTIKKIDFSSSNYSVFVDHSNNRIKIFGIITNLDSSYEMLNIFGQSVRRGKLNSAYIELPTLAKGMYVLKLKSINSEISLPWIY